MHDVVVTFESIAAGKGSSFASANHIPGKQTEFISVFMAWIPSEVIAGLSYPIHLQYFPSVHVSDLDSVVADVWLHTSDVQSERRVPGEENW